MHQRRESRHGTPERDEKWDPSLSMIHESTSETRQCGREKSCNEWTYIGTQAFDHPVGGELNEQIAAHQNVNGIDPACEDAGGAYGA
jgi:hypothetical protein